ncbi:MAG: CRISPR-associated endoribonuclease Cas6 [Candidatus Anstonellales archaeon]
MKLHIKIELENPVELPSDFRGAMMSFVKYLINNPDITNTKNIKRYNFTYFLQKADTNGKGNEMLPPINRSSANDKNDNKNRIEIKYITLKLSLIDGKIMSSVLDRLSELGKSGKLEGVNNDFWSKAGKIRILYTRLMQDPYITTDTAIFKSQSPIVISRAKFDKSANRPKKRPEEIYLTPEDGEEWKAAIVQSLLYRYKHIYNREYTGEIDIQVLGSRSNKLMIKHYRGRVIGWSGKFMVRARPEMLNFIVRFGIGDRTGQGFGYVKLINSSLNRSGDII